jgi:hypothetical protein
MLTTSDIHCYLIEPNFSYRGWLTTSLLHIAIQVTHLEEAQINDYKSHTS